MIKNSSEASAKAVLKYQSAILIISTLWGFIGFAFTRRYLHGQTYVCVFAAILMIFIVIQIERQIILAVGRSNTTKIFRIVIGIVMAIIGSVILDQIMYKDDIVNQNRLNIQNAVNKEMPLKAQQINQQVFQLDSAIQSKEVERSSVIRDIKDRPTISTPTTVIERKKDSTGKLIVVGKSIKYSSIPNPQASRIQPIEEQITGLRAQKDTLENQKINIRQVLENDIKSKVGFLNELTVLFSILFSSWIALVVWILVFIFFLSVELFVLSNKFGGDTQNDYDMTVIHQMTIRLKMLEQLVK